MTADDMSAAESRLRRRARQYLDAGLTDAAQITLEALLERVPDDAPARMELANVLLGRGQLQASTRQLLQIARLPAGNVPLLVQTIRRLYFHGEIVAARSCLDRLERAPDPPAPLLAEQAQLRWMLGEIPAAMALMERASAAGVETPDACYLHAMLSQFTGNIAQARGMLETCLRRWPDFGDAAVALANVRRQTPEANDLGLLRERLRRMPQDSNAAEILASRAGFESALFKELDDLGCPDEAWQALARSNAIMHALHPYDAAGETAVTDAIIHASEALAAKPARPAPPPGDATPIFIVGLPRSGTTLLDRMLSSHSQVVSAGEINDFRRQLRWMTDVPPSGVQGMLTAQRRSVGIDFAELGARYLQQTQWRAQGRRFYIDKLPINVRMVHLISRALPHAPILHMVREPMGVCFSNFKAMLGPASAYSYDMQTLAHYHGQYVRLTNHWHTRMPGAMLDVPYASLVSEPAATLRRVLEHCGLAVEEGCLHPERNMAPVATPSSAQVREPIHQRTLGEWQRYAGPLEPLRLALERAPRQIHGLA
ncbi:tetratricopeptide repeat-containing sulfotransferase family protein [Rhodanobacter denitrificans]|uniref:tetratricopeptide repeat-containing sulfotransferase family protein n=1 Tax=Rhodanobacter denitrificans TaxID=666685 RepID=UPI001F466DA3|nr:sulfotransferase [Rhodanobacter denitrificans]UJJ59981.1 sulfotransferase [Rhodanobacter denitrificans]